MDSFEMGPITTTLHKMKLLLWRLDLVQRAFSSLNDCPEVFLSAEDCRFFKDRAYRDRLVHPDDQIALEQELSKFKERKPTEMVFRIVSNQKHYWYKLVGWPTEDFRFYEGAVEDISPHIHKLKDIFEHQNRMMLEQADVPYPLAIFFWPSCRLLKANLSFVELLKLKPGTNNRKSLQEMLSTDINVPAILETIISNRHITAELTFLTGALERIRASCRLEYFSVNRQSYLRLAILNPGSSSSLPRRMHRVNAGDIDNLCGELENCWSIEALLERIYQHRHLLPELDAVMFSDIYAKKNKVIVYAAGELKEPLKAGSQFAYSGTIAENIEKENLEYLIVDNTQSSIKAIDWMLFVPKGISSYIAKALYVRGAMRTVIIFCSRKKNAFSEQQVPIVTNISICFQKQLKKIRRMQRNPS